MATAYINCIATTMPPHDLHQVFISFAENSAAGRSRAKPVQSLRAVKPATAYSLDFRSLRETASGATISGVETRWPAWMQPRTAL
jgi:hypothetical protein